jgi:hypothetical protein
MPQTNNPAGYARVDVHHHITVGIINVYHHHPGQSSFGNALNDASIQVQQALNQTQQALVQDQLAQAQHRVAQAQHRMAQSQMQMQYAFSQPSMTQNHPYTYIPPFYQSTGPMFYHESRGSGHPYHPHGQHGGFGNSRPNPSAQAYSRVPSPRVVEIDRYETVIPPYSLFN